MLQVFLRLWKFFAVSSHLRWRTEELMENFVYGCGLTVLRITELRGLLIGKSRLRDFGRCQGSPFSFLWAFRHVSLCFQSRTQICNYVWLPSFQRLPVLPSLENKLPIFLREGKGAVWSEKKALGSSLLFKPLFYQPSLFGFLSCPL